MALRSTAVGHVAVFDVRVQPANNASGEPTAASHQLNTIQELTVEPAKRPHSTAGPIMPRPAVCPVSEGRFGR